MRDLWGRTQRGGVRRIKVRERGLGGKVQKMVSFSPKFFNPIIAFLGPVRVVNEKCNICTSRKAEALRGWWVTRET